MKQYGHKCKPNVQSQAVTFARRAILVRAKAWCSFWTPCRLPLILNPNCTLYGFNKHDLRRLKRHAGSLCFGSWPCLFLNPLVPAPASTLRSFSPATMIQPGPPRKILQHPSPPTLSRPQMGAQPQPPAPSPHPGPSTQSAPPVQSQVQQNGNGISWGGPFPALHLWPIQDTFVMKMIHLPEQQRVGLLHVPLGIARHATDTDFAI